MGDLMRNRVLRLRTGDVSFLTVTISHDRSAITVHDAPHGPALITAHLTEAERLALADLLTVDQPRIVLVPETSFRRPRRRSN